jgi:hypothetical protein
MLGLAKRLGGQTRILQTSTSEVYGDPNISPQTEAYWVCTALKALQCYRCTVVVLVRHWFFLSGTRSAYVSVSGTMWCYVVLSRM